MTTSTFEAREQIWRDESPVGWARFDAKREHRFLLGRRLSTRLPVHSPRAHRVAWIMLNPSDAGAEQNDPTLRRVIAFSDAWGFDELIVVNLFSRISSDPDELHRWARHEPFHDAANQHHMGGAVALAARIVCAWGAHALADLRLAPALEMLARHRGGREIGCLGRTKHGAPRHPLYLPKTAQFEPFSLETCQADPSMPGSPSDAERRR